MASSAATQMLSLPWTSSMKLFSHSFSRPNCTRSFFSYRTNPSFNCLSLSASLTSTCPTHVDTNNACSSLRQLCEGHVPDHVLSRAEEVGYIEPTPVQSEALPVLFSGRDCVIHAQTGSGKTLAYLLLIFSIVNAQRSSVQAVIVVPARELGMQVEPPAVVVATLRSLCQMLDKHILKLDALRVLVIDEVDFMFNSSKEVSFLKKLLTTYSSIDSRQTVFASVSIPQHRRFVYDCIQQKWTKANVVHVHVNPIEPMPSCLHHIYMTCCKGEKYSTLLHLLQADAPQSAIIFVGEQSENSKKAGNAPPTTLLIEFLKTSNGGCPELVLLEEDMNFNQRATSLTDLKQSGDYLLVATDIAARGVDLPETTHIYNFDTPKDAINYLHRAGRTGRKPFSDSKCYVTSIITAEERFVLQRFENELHFQCEELFLST